MVSFRFLYGLLALLFSYASQAQSISKGGVSFSGYVGDFYVSATGDLDVRFSFINDEPEVELKWNWLKINYVTYKQVRYGPYNHPGGSADFGYLKSEIWGEVSLLESVPTRGYTTITKKIYDAGTYEYRFQVIKEKWQAMTMAERAEIKEEWKAKHFPTRLTLEDIGGQALRNIFWAVKDRQNTSTASENDNAQDSARTKAEEQLRLAEAAMARQDYTTALSYLTEAMNLDPNLNRLAEQIREVKEIINQLKQGVQSTANSGTSWDTNDGAHAWDEMEEDISFDTEPMLSEENSMADEQAFEQQSRQKAGDLVPNNSSTNVSTGNAEQGQEPNYSGGLCYSLSQRFNRLYKKKYKLESQFTSSMEQATRSGNVNQAQIERINQQLESVYKAIQTANEERYQALKEKRLSPECHQDIQDLASSYDDASINNMEQSVERMQRNAPDINQYKIPKR